MAASEAALAAAGKPYHAAARATAEAALDAYIASRTA